MEDDIYLPLLTAFKDEIIQISKIDSLLPIKLLEFLIGKNNLHKINSANKDKHHTIKKSSFPKARLPTRIVNFDSKPDSKTTLELYMDESWQMSFRIHNASSIVETSLKFDIQLIGQPVSIIFYDCNWD